MTPPPAPQDRATARMWYAHSPAGAKYWYIDGAGDADGIGSVAVCYSENALANARLIVTAVNSFDSHRAALSQAEKAMYEADVAMRGTRPALVRAGCKLEIFDAQLEQVQSALAALEVK